MKFLLLTGMSHFIKLLFFLARRKVEIVSFLFVRRLVSSSECFWGLPLPRRLFLVVPYVSVRAAISQLSFTMV
ncbi:Uncharacterized protein TCM_019787 [Theobroma cacao]|uniref:Uncharacterized protein n=1 Tax=Theobroma cacao TaxID=3641 RepID=A0A061EQF1_THECC|nr:Uncharacterized protein TCM_019787 [Theobroma cacao]